jgi:hypothetical protein
VCKECHYP